MWMTQLDKIMNFRAPSDSPQLTKVQGNHFVFYFPAVILFLGLVDVTNLSYLMMVM